MSNLVPEKRLDKNGRLVTKHVRNGADQSSTRSAIPAPTADSSQVKITKVRRPVYRDIMRAAGHEKMSNKTWDQVRHNLAPLSDEELNEVHSVATRYEKDFPSVTRGILAMSIRGGNPLNGARTVDTICSGISHQIDDQHSIAGAILGLGMKDHPLLGLDLSIPEGKEKIARAHVLAIEAMAENVGNAGGEFKMGILKNSMYLDDGPFKDFVEENADRAEDIARAIRSRCTADIDTLRELMDHDVHSLTDGVL